MNVNSVLLKLPRRFQTPVKLIWQYILLWFSGWYQKWKKKRLLFWTTILNFWIFKCLVHCANFESENWTSENHFYFCSWIRKLHSGKFCTILGKPHTDRRYRKVFCTESISSHHLSYFLSLKNDHEKVGLSAAPLWGCMSQYVTVHSKLNGQSLSTNMGIFYCIYQANQIIGNLISSIVFQDGFPKLSSINTSQDVSLCGINYWWVSNFLLLNQSGHEPSHHRLGMGWFERMTIRSRVLSLIRYTITGWKGQYVEYYLFYDKKI